MFKEIDYFRLKFVKENGVVKKLVGLYDNGKTDENSRDPKTPDPPKAP